MKMKPLFPKALICSLLLAATPVFVSCEESMDDEPEGINNQAGDEEVVFLIIDEESIDNGNEPNNFSETDVNDQLADLDQRDQLKFFKDNVGQTIDLYTGQVGDEGWHAPLVIPGSWVSAGPTNNGLRNYLEAGPGLGGGNDDPEVLLDEIPNVVPLRATGLAILEGQTVFALVHDSDVSTNYSPIQSNLQGSYLGVVAFEVLEVTERTGGSDSDLPKVRIRILDAETFRDGPFYLFQNAPIPQSSSEPEDTTPPANPPAIVVELAE